MTAIPNAFVMSVVARHRIAEFHAEADRDRLVRVALTGTGRRRWPNLLSIAGIVLALALPFMAAYLG